MRLSLAPRGRFSRAPWALPEVSPMLRWLSPPFCQTSSAMPVLPWLPTTSLMQPIWSSRCMFRPCTHSVRRTLVSRSSLCLHLLGQFQPGLIHTFPALPHFCSTRSQNMEAHRSDISLRSLLLPISSMPTEFISIRQQALSSSSSSYRGWIRFSPWSVPLLQLRCLHCLCILCSQQLRLHPTYPRMLQWPHHSLPPRPASLQNLVGFLQVLVFTTSCWRNFTSDWKCVVTLLRTKFIILASVYLSWLNI